MNAFATSLPANRFRPARTRLSVIGLSVLLWLCAAGGLFSLLDRALASPDVSVELRYAAPVTVIGPRAVKTAQRGELDCSL